jgi:uncharacterized protein (TIGR00369 family)
MAGIVLCLAAAASADASCYSSVNGAAEVLGKGVRVMPHPLAPRTLPRKRQPVAAVTARPAAARHSGRLSAPEASMPAQFHLPDLQPGWRDDLAAAIEAMPAARLVGLRVRGFTRDGRSLLELPVVPALTFDGRVVQGGIVGLLADFAGVSAASSQLPAGWAASTTGFEVHNVAPAAGEQLLAVGEAVAVGKSHAVSTARVWALAQGQVTLAAVATTTCRPFEIRR